MLYSPLPIPPSSEFWPGVARALVRQGLLAELGAMSAHDFSAVRVLMPNFANAQQLKAALARELGSAFIPPRITTLSAWLGSLPPDPQARPAPSSSERMMSLYAELRQHAWLKKLFTARRNTDLMPLAQTLLTLFDELTQALLPTMQAGPDAAEERWQAALEQLSAPARSMLSDEAQLVWSIWKTQLDTSDAIAQRFSGMLRLARYAADPLIWISATEPDTPEKAFLEEYAQHQPVLPITLSWQASKIHPAYAAAWPELLDEGMSSTADAPAAAVSTPTGLALCSTSSLEEEALRGAQTVIDWLQAGKSCVAIIAQDRVVARRIRALLERAQVFVADETGWKLSTTRSAAAIAALLEVFASRAETIALLDLLKSPFLFPEIEEKSDLVMAIEHALRKANVPGGWDACIGVLRDQPAAQELLQRIAQQAGVFTGRKTLQDWVAATNTVLAAVGMRDALEMDAAGAQVIALFDMLAQDCQMLGQAFSFAEWRVFLNLQLESTSFLPADFDHRVVMLQLNGARLRSFDAVLMVGADADHLPSQSNETLFFANAVRRELGLATREMRQRAQMRDFAEVLQSNTEVVLSWQAHKNGEPNPPSPWIERLQLALERAGAGRIPAHATCIQPRQMMRTPVSMPAPSAPQLLPLRLSASAYNSLVACPYQFFATRMLNLAGLEEFSDMPEKRDYGDWLHRILTEYHETVRDCGIKTGDREFLLQEISERIFGEALERSAAALGYYARWRKVIPAYVAWANERESQGWQFFSGEHSFEKTINWSDGKITLHGRIDRIDHNAEGERAVLDYKTKNLQALRDKLKEGEDHQLAFYGLLSDLPVAAAHYVALEASKDKTGDVPAQNYEEWQQALETQLVATMQAIAGGAALRATGIEKICVYCEVRGLCRKGAW
ncbi:PD-(D/E)XK nuclease family protein [Noviherbaspirillum massiliense]|uniref:PD-(D/E)XK nuclease family protein n=1 Tax=Noviherbaspirillum massiliense TaxID=1465823 RepID=UPI000475065A|nr:PD-(D/E)XK nuclease family protein [Noviherbaspirillum massiliense]